MAPLRVVSAFSGVGGFDIAFERAGCEIVAQIENDPACQQVLRQRFPGVPLFGDISEVRGADLPEFDVLAGGFPCQDLSVAGSRAGLKGERSGLFFEFARLAEETRPTWFILENVAGLLSSHRGRDMGTLLGTMGELGYWWAYRCLDAQFFGVPQRRRRIFVVGHSGNGACPREVLFEPEGGHRNPPKSRTTRSAAPVARAVTESFGTGGADLAHAAEAGWIGAYGGHPAGEGDGAPPAAWAATHGIAPCLQEREHKGQDSSATRAMAVGFYPTGGTQSVAPVQDGSPALKVGSGIGIPSSPAIAYSIYPESGQGADLRATECAVSPTVSATDGGKSSERGVRIVQAHPVAERGRGEATELEMGEEGVYNALRAGDGGSSRHQLVTYVKQGGADETKEETFTEASGAPNPCLSAADAHRTRTLVVHNRRSSLIGAAAGTVWRRLSRRRRRLGPDERLEAGGAVAFDWQAGGATDKSWQGGSRIWTVKQGDYAGSLSTSKVQAVAYKPGVSRRRLPAAYRKATKAHFSGDWERWEEAEKADTLAAEGGTQAATAVVFSQNGSDVQATEGRTAALRAEGTSSGNGGVNVVMEGVEKVAGTVQASASRCRDGQPGGGGIREGVDRMTYLPMDTGAQLAVRRLMPVECSRLQGFPDTWLELECGHCAEAPEARSRALLRILWREAAQEAGAGRGPGVTAPLLSPEVLLAGVHGGWIPWSLAHRCAAASREVQGEDAWPEGFMRRLRQFGEARPAPYRREPFEQLARELGRPLSALPLAEARAAEDVLHRGLWEKASAEWAVRHARSAHEAAQAAGTLKCALSVDSHKYRQLGNAVAVPVVEWIARRLAKVHADPPEDARSFVASGARVVKVGRKR